MQACSRSRHGEERPQRDQSVGSPKGSAPFLLAVSRSRAAGGGGARCRASSNDNEFLLGLGGKRSQRLFPPVVENEGNCLPEIRKTLVARVTLPIRTRNLSAVGNVPRAVLLHHRCKLVAHNTNSLPPWNTVAPIAPASRRLRQEIGMWLVSRPKRYALGGGLVSKRGRLWRRLSSAGIDEEPKEGGC